MAMPRPQRAIYPSVSEEDLNRSDPAMAAGLDALRDMTSHLPAPVPPNKPDRIHRGDQFCFIVVSGAGLRR
jgi:hypothetical protein